MVSTLRIAGIVAVVLAGLLLASVTGFASIKTLNAQTDEELGKVLRAPSVVERFQERQGDIEQSRQEAINPLVKEAEIYSTILNPPAPPQPPRVVVRDPGRPSREVAGPVVTSAKFDLLGTCYSAAGQADCLAYIQMRDGKTSQWVRVGDVIGHMTIKEIRSDSIVCWDGNGDVPLSIPQRINQADFLEGGAGAAVSNTVEVAPSSDDRITGPSGAWSSPAAAFRPAPRVVGGNPLAPRTIPPEAPSDGGLAATITRLKQAAEGSPEQAAERQALVEQMTLMHETTAARRMADEEEAARINREAAGRPPVSPLRGRSTPARPIRPR